MVSVDLDNLHRLLGGKRVLENDRIAEKAVEFSEDEFGDDHSLLLGDGFQPPDGCFLTRRILVEAVKEDVGVDGQHGVIDSSFGSAFPRLESFGPRP